MTREEANKELERAFDVLDHTCHMDNRRKEAFNMARVALSAEPCEDAISREEVCDYIAEFVNHEYATDREREMVKNIISGIQHLPSIQPKTGHWKKTGFIDKVICDVCNKRVWDTFTDGVLNFQYCPNCGAKMLPTDSEKER